MISIYNFQFHFSESLFFTNLVLMLKIGHRGAKGHSQENTLASISKAITFGVDMVEVDVHRCKSGELVVFHDFTVDRMTHSSGAVADFTWAELKAMQRKDGGKIPLLEDVLVEIAGQCKINIELKGANTALPVADLIQKYIKKKEWRYTDFLVSSFQKNELFKLFDADKQIPLGVLSKASMIEAIALGKQIQAVNIHPATGIVTQKNIGKAHDAGFKIFVWTVNDPKVIARMKNWGVDGIISDFPDLL